MLKTIYLNYGDDNPLWNNSELSFSDKGKIFKLCPYIDKRNILRLNNLWGVSKPYLNNILNVSQTNCNNFFNKCIKNQILFPIKGKKYKTKVHKGFFVHKKRSVSKIIRTNFNWSLLRINYKIVQPYTNSNQLIINSQRMDEIDVSYHVLGLFVSLFPYMDDGKVSIDYAMEILNKDKKNKDKFIKQIMQLECCKIIDDEIIVNVEFIRFPKKVLNN